MNNRLNNLGITLTLSFLVASCGSTGAGSRGTGSNASDAGVSPATGEVACPVRGELCLDAMFKLTSPALIDYQYFAPPANADAAVHAFNGRLTVGETRSRRTSGRGGYFPAFTADFITVNGDLVPVNQGLMRPNPRRVPNIVLSPGKVWSEAGDQGFSRAAIPFVLGVDRENQARNGVATFVFDESRVSRVFFQVAQETAPNREDDLWGVAEASYVPGTPADADRVRKRHLRYLATRLPVQSWGKHASEGGYARPDEFNRSLAASAISQTALVIDGVVYAQPPVTREGRYPFPREMRHAAYSITKSAGAAIALLRLAEKFGAEVFDAFVTDYVKAPTRHSGWNGVTFGQLLSMTAGVGNNSPRADIIDTFADENDMSNPNWVRFFLRPDASAKLNAAFSYRNYPWSSGQIVRYNTTHSFVLATAMENFLQQMSGTEANLWTMLKNEVFDPLGIEDIPVMRSLSGDGQPSTPILGFGMYLNINDTAKIAELLQSDGQHAGRQILHKEKTREALRKAAATAYPTDGTAYFGSSALPVNYLYGFWGFEVDTGGCRANVTYMEGAGGSFVVLLPNGVSAIRYADANVMDPGALASAASQIRPLC